MIIGGPRLGSVEAVAQPSQVQDLNKQQLFSQKWLIDKSIIVKDKPINQPIIWHMPYLHISANLWWTYLRWTPFLMCFSWGPFKGWFFGDFIQTWSSRSWEFSPKLIFWALASSSIPEYLVLIVQIVVLDSVWVGFDGCFQRNCFVGLRLWLGYAWIALMIFSTRRLQIGQFGEVFQFFLAQG